MNNIINEIVGGRYYVLELLGEGGTSNVFKAMDIHTKEICALKRYITSDPANNKTLLEGMERELSVLKHCTHPVLPKIYNLIKEQEDFYLVMEYVEGIDLRSYVETNGTLKKREIKNIMEQICSGLYYLHSLEPPVIYRDLKPSNVILTDEQKIKLTKKEFEIMELLILNSDKTVPKERLTVKVWGYDSDIEYNSIEVYISFLRKKLKAINSNVHIITVRSIGYTIKEQKNG